ncbi:MAG: hypothetical protein FJ387_10510 [Verrucomicrobia bacterium]|nr:hypothetical protein [Verrucomicrobiota bacterium]
MRGKWWFWTILILSGAVSVLGQGKTRATLVLSAATAQPGETVTAGIRLEMAPGWHTYWRNPGESGLAAAVEWTLPPGIRAGALQWPPPETHTAAGLTTYVYHGVVMLLVPLELAKDLAPGPKEIAAKVSWLECQEACVTGDAQVKATLAIGAPTAPATDAEAIENWRRRLPQSAAGFQVNAQWDGAPSGNTAALLLSGAVRDGFRPANFMAYADNDFEVLPAVEVLPADPGRFLLRKQVKRYGPGFPAVLSGIFVAAGSEAGTAPAYEVQLEPAAAGTGAAALPDPVPGGSLASPAVSVSGPTRPAGSLWTMLGLAFLGGLILNVMPCVLPVIALKILGFVQQSQQTPSRVRLLGVLYGAGVLVSFLALGAVVIGVQQAGGAASWGMQMQNPYFRLALLLVVLLVTLNLFGLFEVTLGGGAMTAASTLASREGAVGAFANGVLATALATPCTAPFLTVALGFAFTQSPGVVLLMFAVTALGLAAPYVVLSWKPTWLKFLPKPGPWMERFKVAMGFPMLATAIWLFDLTAPTFGSGGTLWLGLLVVVLALAAWVWGEFVQRGARYRPWAIAFCLGLLALGYGYVLERQLQWRHPHVAIPEAGIVQDYPDGLEWHRWSPAAVAQARAAGRPVLVDFTAKWCLTCLSNKKLAIDIPEVRARLKELNAVAMRADNTNVDPAIVDELKRYGRAGVPLVLVFPGRAEAAPIELPALLTPGIVMDALEKVRLATR